MFTRRQMSQLGAGGGGRPRRPRPGQVRKHLVNRLRVGLGGAAGRSEAGRCAEAPPPRRAGLSAASISQLLMNATRGGPGPHHRQAPAGGRAEGDPRLAFRSSRHCPAFPGRRTGRPPNACQSCNPLPGRAGALQRPQAPPCPGANPGEFGRARGPGPGPDSEVAWHCTSLRSNSSGTHYATWHQPLTWLQGDELPGGTGAGSLLGAPLRRGRATSPPVTRSEGLEFSFSAKCATGNNAK